MKVTKKRLAALHWLRVDWCPNCGVSEAFHPEVCPITPEQWRRKWSWLIGLGLSLASQHGRRMVR